MNFSNDIIASLLENPFASRSEEEKRLILKEGRTTPKLTHIHVCKKGRKRNVWCNEGYNDWKNLSIALDRHSSSKDHIQNEVTFKTLSKESLTVLEQINEQAKRSRKAFNEIVAKNRQIFKNDIIECIAMEIKETICNIIRDSPFFSIQVDETTDKSELTQCSVICRCVDSLGKIKEHFLGFYDVDPESLFDCPAPGYYPFEGDCIRFYKCVETDLSQLKGLLYRCPEGFGYSEDRSRCLKEKDLPVCQRVPQEAHLRVESATQLYPEDLLWFFKN
ncbi:hypothetical protein Anas_10730 [Armadillidium nasatum]|uniref:Chitin-binding type-2 domain-containing protein n=1 Tax=Armadillidium nasatum TaxID=96803 RepID=A0A5N5T9R0_9CRUS|nr:hypothetical protein Anas_10730 [Armadillidium nasatum]